MDPLLVLLALWLLYGVALGLRRLLAGRRPRPVPAGARRRPLEPGQRAIREPAAPRSWPAPETIRRQLEGGEPHAPRAEPLAPPAERWRRRLAEPETLREAVVAAEILRRGGARWTPARPSRRRGGAPAPGAPP